MNASAASQIRRGIRLARTHLAEIAAGRHVSMAVLLDCPDLVVDAYDRTMQKAGFA